MSNLLETIKLYVNPSKIFSLTFLILISSLAINLYSPNNSYGAVSAKVDFLVISDWETGFTGEITITNLSNQSINNWTLEFDYDQNITSLWNGEMTSNGRYYTVQHPSWSSDIGPNSSVTFGFVVSGSSSDRPTNYRLNGMDLENTPAPTPAPTPTPTQVPETPNDDIEFSFTVTDDWISGYNAEIKIINNSDQIIANWVLEFDFSQDISSLWNGELTRDGNHYTVSHPSWNPDIAPNSTVSFGFGGSPGNITDEPTGYVLKGELQDGGSGDDGSGDDTGSITEAPAKPTISILKDWQNGGFTIEWNKWYGIEGTSWEVFENGQIIHEESIQTNNGGEQSGSFHISEKNYGVFYYKVVLVNSAGRTESDEVYYSVDGASLIVIDSIDIDGQALQATTDQGVPTDFAVRMIDNDNPDFVLSTNNKSVITYSMIDRSTIRIEGLKSGRSSIRIEEINSAEVRFLGVRVRDENGNLPGMPEYLAIASVSEDTQADLDFWKDFSDDDLKNRRIDIRYIYINGGPKNQGIGWRTWTVVDGFRVTSYIRESLKLGMVPFLVYYNIPDGGESYFIDKQHIESLDYMEGYFTDLKFALELAAKEAGDELVGFLLEPDFLGYFAQNDGRPQDIFASTDAAYSSGALERGIDPDFPNTLAGLVEAINYTIRKHMPSAYFGWQFNLWASPAGGFTNTIPGNGIVHLSDTLGITAGRTAIINESGAITDYYIDAGVLTQGADFVSIDKYGLDAGAEGKSDDPSTATWFWNAVHWTNYLTFVSVMHEKTQLPVILWQIPVGRINESQAFSPYHSDGKFPILENVATRYEDSAPTYFFGDTFITDGNRFTHFTQEDGGISDVSSNGQQITWGPHIDLARDSGVTAILFGAGVGISTDGVGSPPTDDYWWITKVQEYFRNPVPLE